MSLSHLLGDLLYKPEEIDDESYDELVKEFNAKGLELKKERVAKEERKFPGGKKQKKRKKVQKHQVTGNNSAREAGTVAHIRKRFTTGIHEELSLSPALQDVCRTTHRISRMKAIVLVSEYIIRNGQRVEKGIKCDEKPRRVFGNAGWIENRDVFRLIDPFFARL